MDDNELIFQDTRGNLVIVMSRATQRLKSYRQLYRSTCESAGVLIGERRGAHLVIWDLSEPGKGDVQSRCSVNRKGGHHQDKVNSAFLESGGTLQYVGEWHTHPEDTPSPSTKDRTSWLEKIDSTSPMILLIVGRKSLWGGKLEGSIITQLTP